MNNRMNEILLPPALHTVTISYGRATRALLLRSNVKHSDSTRTRVSQVI